MNGSSAARRNTEEWLTVLLGSVGATGVCVGGETDCQKVSAAEGSTARTRKEKQVL